MTAWNVLEVMGIVAFSVSGALTGIRSRFDIFSVLTFTVITAIGGGVMRDVIIGNTPPLSFRDPTFLISSCATTMTIFFTYRRLDRYQNTSRFFDAIGLGAFTATGANLAMVHQLNSLFGVTAVAVIAGIGGSLVRDTIVREIHYVFRREVYFVNAIIGASVFYYSQLYLPSFWPLYLCFIVTIVLGLCHIKYKWNFPALDPDSKKVVSGDHESG
ncbi:trimeric intracellular cation channel family protein [Acetonema longum]|uniref:Glycine transporter domain-containing protein n=1 Tax=Acetonema longum DSM 6540 TaxID=1009370 RepID=F7NH45_9FIRM|nr:trimeric intracellular cation channel family protein [Acetonema longum]EGO64647.1 hypothetical protein ALO_06943 [Acetonema longum DSM 6540]